MKKYQLTGQPIYVGETYNHNGDLYRVESFDEGYTEPKVTLRRIKDGTIFDVEAPALFLTPMGVQLLRRQDGWELDAVGAALYDTPRGVEIQWDYSLNGHFVPRTRRA